MRQEGVDTRFLLRSELLASGVGFILLDEQGVPAMVTSMGANAELCESDVERALEQLAGAQVYLTQFEIRPEVALNGARIARGLGMTTLVNPAPAVPMQEGAYCNADILTPNESEARLLLGMDPLVEIEPEELVLGLYQSSGAGCVLVTLGEQGITGADKQGIWRVAPPRVNVVDTSGAGDVFCAALAVGLTKGMQVRVASDWACQVAALSVTCPGTIPSYPTSVEVRAFIDDVKWFSGEPVPGLSESG